ncbi:MAG: Tol-Pal system beta propeller repeat protein TolB [Desulfobacter sp.]|jgi:TolB protein|uniref:Tol-Pal system beta propeller repeat protein TolB n=1 Tax=uncultured Desulfobacter sp. TaxID=240139 RepID=UPI0029C7C52D|nr:Tol-Pal system beta propeller repeat protein TolB [uncultured Desulfobacter sp.]MCW8801196.1 Tol-Pal system beta propeller repeat protein TolB [Desulfobacter sp.]
MKQNKYFRVLYKAVWVWAILVLPAVQAQAKDYDYISISNPFLNKTPVAVTSFKAFSGHEAEVAAGVQAEQILKAGLDFTGYLKIMNSTAFLSNPAESGIQLGQINFKDWTGIGAELLVTGGVEERDGQVKLQLRLMDTFNTKLLVGKIYSGPVNRIRAMVHRFCAEVAKALTGNFGVFGSKIVFVSTVNGNKEIYTCDFDGFNPRQITYHKSISLSPAWSDDGQWLAYVSYAKGKPDIFIKNLKNNLGAIINYKGINISPDWMPRKLNLAATLSFSGDQEIYLLTRKGEIIKRVTKSWGSNVSPKFSPDGKTIAFTSSRSGNPQIYIQGLDSEEARRVTFTGKYNTSPAWSPDGKKIAYVGIEKNKINIFVISVDPHIGTSVQLTAEQGDNEDPCWSPDGSLIVFKSNRKGGKAHLFVMTAAGTEQRRLLSMPGIQSEPDWSGDIGFSSE